MADNELKVGDTIRCRDLKDMIKTSKMLNKHGVEVAIAKDNVLKVIRVYKTKLNEYF